MTAICPKCRVEFHRRPVATIAAVLERYAREPAMGFDLARAQLVILARELAGECGNCALDVAASVMPALPAAVTGRRMRLVTTAECFAGAHEMTPDGDDPLGVA